MFLVFFKNSSNKFLNWIFSAFFFIVFVYVSLSNFLFFQKNNFKENSLEFFEGRELRTHFLISLCLLDDSLEFPLIFFLITVFLSLKTFLLFFTKDFDEREEWKLYALYSQPIVTCSQHERTYKNIFHWILRRINNYFFLEGKIFACDICLSLVFLIYGK